QLERGRGDTDAFAHAQVLVASMPSRASMLLIYARACGALHQFTRCTGRRQLAQRASTIASETDAVEYVVKRSRFVAHAAPCTSFDEAEGFLARHRDDKARHNCWAWVGATSARMSDDGEPTGTAAAPIRAAIEGAEFVDCAVIVTRYKASTAPKLGAGGLIRAYGQAARDCLKTAVAAPAAPPRIAIDLVVAPEAYGGVRGLLSAWSHRGVTVASEDYRDDGAALIELTLDDADVRAPFLREAEAAGASIRDDDS
ncbi:unnamed protein product, partial [Pelagomonas calceolata]